MQNRAARAINQVGFDVRSQTLREELGWETLASRRLKHKAIMMYKVLNGLAPAYLSDFFPLNSAILRYELRNRDKNVVLPKPKTEYLKKSFKFSGAKLWNDLPMRAKMQNTLQSFKRELPALGS